MGGLMLLTAGVLGEYIVRVFDQVRDRPLSLISQVHRASAEVVTQPGSISIQNGKLCGSTGGLFGKANSRAA